MALLNESLVRAPGYGHEAPDGPSGVDWPDPGHLDLPEKILQFGTGRFLRGFCDYFVDRANRQGLFNGRIVAVSSTGSGRGNLLDDQDGLYTLVVRGLDGGRPTETLQVCSSISRALVAQDDWPAVLEVARSPDLEAVISNTTEVGIQLDEDDALDADPPRSFPGKLTAVLYERARTFNYDPERGLVVLPCELIVGNGDALKDIVLTLAERWSLGGAFTEWVASANVFCNTLVDRIVTGLPSEDELHQLWERLGYEDHLLTVAEVYRLWAVEGDEALKQRFAVLRADPGITVAEDITPYRERKVRILNGTHTVMVPAALLAGHDTVLEAMNDPLTSGFIRGVMMEEIVPSLDVGEGAAFGEAVLDRFRNPYLEHLLLNITFQQTSKLRHRVVPSLLAYHRKTGTLPERILVGFACYLWFMKASHRGDGHVYGKRKGTTFRLDDDRAPDLFDRWQNVDPDDDESLLALVHSVCADESLWGTDLTALPGLVETVTNRLSVVAQDGARAALETVARTSNA